MGLLDNFLEKRLQKASEKVKTTVLGEVVSHIDAEILKARGSDVYATGVASTKGVKRYAFSTDMINGGIQRRKKPGTNISFETLRNFSISHEISRACINLRKRQITGLNWNIVPAEADDTSTYDTQIKEVKDFFKTLGGRGIGYRRFIDRFIEDLMVLDAVSLEKQLTRANSLYSLVPIDAATIRLRVDESGATPEPPEAAYVQVIRGTVTAEFTDDEMIYEMMNPRNDTPYGLAPLESLIIIVSSSLSAGMYNLDYLADGNIPEGLFTMPDTWQPGQIKEFQEYFDALLAGNPDMTSRLKFMPQGTYTPTKKRDDMAFAEFNDWLMKVTCALFEVTPIEVGFNPKTGLGGTGYSEQQGEVAENKGILPMAHLIMDLFTKVIQEDLGYTELKFDFPDLQQKDEKALAETNEILIRSGQATINELRTDAGKDPIPGLDKPFYAGQVTYLDQESQDAAVEAAQAAAEAPTVVAAPVDDETTNASEDDATKFENVLTLRKQQVDELKTFKKYSLNRIKAGKSIRPFVSKVLPLQLVEELNREVVKATDAKELRKVFEEPMNNIEMLSIDTALEARNRILELV